MNKVLAIFFSIFLLTGLIGLPATAQAAGGAFGEQVPENISEGPQRAYGTASTTILSLQPLAFRGWDATEDALVTANSGNRTCSSSCILVESVSLPTGAIIDSVEIEVNDTDPAGEVAFLFGNCPTGQAACTLLATAGSGVTETPGYTFPTDFPSHTVNNFNNTYLFQIDISGTAELAGARVWYSLQVSPAPGSATFPDVGTGHWAFQYIEALVDTGVIAGKPDGLFHPSDPITRAEISKLIAQLLGVHWPL